MFVPAEINFDINPLVKRIPNSPFPTPKGPDSPRAFPPERNPHSGDPRGPFNFTYLARQLPCSFISVSHLCAKPGTREDLRFLDKPRHLVRIQATSTQRKPPHSDKRTLTRR